jgi:hypothetical protein
MSMNVVRRLGLLAATTGALACLTAVPATAAYADPVVTAAVPSAPMRCRPAHDGRDWRWDDTRRGGHWDHRVWNRRAHRFEWQHQFRDNRFCAPFRGPGRPGDGPFGNGGNGNGRDGNNQGGQNGRSGPN